MVWEFTWGDGRRSGIVGFKDLAKMTAANQVFNFFANDQAYIA